MTRIRLRTMMILVAVAAGMLASIKPARKWYGGRLWHLAQVEESRRMEAKYIGLTARDQRLANDRDAIRSKWMSNDDFVRKSEVEKEKAIDDESRMYLKRSQRWMKLSASCAEHRRELEPGIIWGTSERYRKYIKRFARSLAWHVRHSDQVQSEDIYQAATMILNR